ncbi:MAG: hypothetical protein M1561_00110 [Gammaproteobacteria bacterium]|nr:hypothetical protein [Gammaproteobacteria bacterium]
MQDDGNLSSPKARGKRLRLLRRMSGLTLNQLADKYDIGISTIKYWECAKSEGLSAKGAKKILSAMLQEGINVSFMWLMYGVGLPPHFIDARFCNQELTNSLNNSSSLESEASITDEISLFCNKIPNSITLTIFDDSMEPLFTSGDGVGGKRLYGSDLTKAIGKNCIIETADNQIICRKIAQGNGAENFNLFSINPHTVANPPFLYDVKIVSAAPIVRIWKRFW